jgi:hypothetical protein
MLLRCIPQTAPCYSDRQEARAQLCLAVGAHAMRDLRDRGGRNLPRELCFLAPEIVKSNFLRYNAQVNSFAPAIVQPALGVAATILECLLGVTLLLGIFTRLSHSVRTLSFNENLISPTCHDMEANQ